MSEIETFSFSNEGAEAIKNYKYGSDWPIVYIIENGSELYVGETIRGYARTKQHLEKPERKRLKTIHIISDDEGNKSASLDTESSLIEYFVADGKFKLQNGNGGLQNHNYYDRESYKAKFEVLWTKLQKMKLAKNDLLQIRNSDIFKYSPYKTLTDEQYLIVKNLLREIEKPGHQNFVIHGGPGTGKTIAATFLIKQLVEKGEADIALVIAMSALRRTLKKVFREIPGLSSSMVIGPNEVANKKYKVLVVDETHRLRQRRNIPNYGSFDQTNRELGLPIDGDELDWILKSAEKVVLFYDAKQSVRPSDISLQKMKDLEATQYTLNNQMRIKGGEEYIKFVDELLECTKSDINLKNYDFKMFDDIDQMIDSIKEKEAEHSLCRLVAGYAWKWVSKDNKSIPDIIIGNIKLFWNSQLTDWVNSKNAINEVGCIHTIQGYDLNYAGVIIGKELSYNKTENKLSVKKNEYFDANGHRGVTDPEELRRYIINIYKTLLTRGILGTYVYVVDEELREYFNNCLKNRTTNIIEENAVQDDTLITSPYTSENEFVQIPLYDSIGCGELAYANSYSEENIKVPSWLIKTGAKYFALRTRGDSMNNLEICDGDVILCQKNYQAASGSVAVVLIGEDATLKRIKYEKDGLVLIPDSKNPIHRVRKLTENDEEFKVLGIYICKINQQE